jgi:lipopolysaccharide export LptBFGC system permease protein LptF
MTKTPEETREELCEKNKCEDTPVNYTEAYDTTDDSKRNRCCYDLAKKMREFLHKDTYLLRYPENSKKDDEITDRMRILYGKFFQAYTVRTSKPISSSDNERYFNIFGILPLELMPASYIPFNYKKFDMNLDRLTKGESFTDDDYKKIFVDYDPTNKKIKENKTKYIDGDDLKKYLTYCLDKKLSNPKATFNAYNTYRMTAGVCVLWFIIIIMMLFVLYSYYRDAYSYILLGIIIIVVLIAIISKMIYILNLD